LHWKYWKKWKKIIETIKEELPEDIEKFDNEEEEIVEIEEAFEYEDDYNYDEEEEKEEFNSDDDFSEDSYSELSKLERQKKKDEKRPDFINGMKVLKYELTPQLKYEEDVRLQEMVNPDKDEEESDEEDYLMGTTNRIKVKGKVLLSAEAIYDKFVSNKKNLEGLNIIQEKRAEIRNKKIVLVPKENTQKQDKEDQKAIDEELLELEKQDLVEKIKGLKRRGEKLTAEEKKKRKETMKEIKNERKIKKQQFKNKFDQNVKYADKKNYEQAKEGNIQGISVVKIN